MSDREKLQKLNYFYLEQLQKMTNKIPAYNFIYI